MLGTLFIFAIVLGLLVFIHEMGHFITAKRNGIKADEFGFGFPPRIIGVLKDRETGRYKIVWGSQNIESRETIYSLNWIPLGGFVRIKGEDMMHSHEPDSFASKGAWTRIKVLGAGVAMNFLLAWFLFTVVLTLGFPQQINPQERALYPKTDVQILQVVKGSPAESMGLQPGDLLLSIDGIPVTNLEMVSASIGAKKGQLVTLRVDRGGIENELSGTPRLSFPEGEGALGISFSETAIVSYSWYEAVVRGLIHTYEFTIEILKVFGNMLWNFITGQKVAVDIAGPVGIIYMTKQMSELGLVYILQFAAILSINLAIINALPIPALDGGRILFVLIEKIKGSPVSQKTEGYFHQAGFLLLLLLMVFVTLHDFLQFDIWAKFLGLF